MRTYPKLIGLLVSALLLAGACGGGDDPVEVGQAGTRPTPTTEEATTTTEALTTTTSPAPSIVEIPEQPEWGASWTGPAVTPGSLRMGEFNQFVLDNAPAEVTPEEAVAVYLQLDPADPNAQMLVGGSTGPESTRVAVVLSVEGDDSVRAFRYEFVVEMRSRDFLAVAEEEGEEAEEGDSDEADDELDTNEGDAATGEDLEVIEPDAIPWVLSAELTVQCQPGRGHQDFSPELCV